ncbi:endonuclease/exonuclease/phosphatase family protein [Pseudoalteromonas sp. HL-AS2]|uniref:endonuclease/exonuclease/phosphatase family protein n=1 Tax=Pseudoalteromonas TaxID=53246 RepID=UPI0028159DD7|nr:endonuclease/exonuclease/phosphatase family protein [Pseudoalteromonas sp. HL-AS2]WMS94295.1 endonuclease/exonuclease/phosphatase family protein [Pseudoalteromonas sp. HL-AS2]
MHKKLIRCIIAACSFLTINSSLALAQLNPSDEAQGITETAYTPLRCNQQLQASRQKTYSRKFIVPQQARLLSWNIYKAQNQGLYKDLTHLNETADIVLLQEAIVDTRLTSLKPFWRFSPGYKSGNVQSGVMTLSRWPATVHCTFIHKEPWLRSPKATNIVEYAMANQQRLLSVNLHGINFTFGTKAYAQQLQASIKIMQQHKGPILFAGDLNAWSDARQKLVNDALTKLGLKEAIYVDDKRTKAFGLALDQVWARGVVISDTLVSEYNSSDHNPILATLKVDDV